MVDMDPDSFCFVFCRNVVFVYVQSCTTGSFINKYYLPNS